MRVPLSHRLPPTLEPNRLAARLAAARAAGVPVLDLTESNPTRVGIDYPGDLLDTLSDAPSRAYDPSPFGLWRAREAVAFEAARRGARIDPAQVVLSASTSEAYAWLFKLLCNPGECVLVPRPSYPLFEHLARLEGVGLRSYDLAFHGRWDIDLGAIEAGGPDVRAVIVVSPNNPTGSCISTAEFARVATACRDRGWALVADEVFSDYLHGGPCPPRDLAAESPCLTVTLGGLSKSVGLPQVKVGWLVVGGPEEERRRALAGLEVIADAFLSVSSPAQHALSDLLARGAVVRQRIAERLDANLARLAAFGRDSPGCDALPVEGGWSAVLRVPATQSEEALVLELLERERILVHPGYFFDFRHEAYLVLSLLVHPETFARGLDGILRVAGRQGSGSGVSSSSVDGGAA